MSFDVKKWSDNLKQKILERFEKRVIFIGLQGSYARGEATTDSDIDIVVILDKLDIEDLKEYKKIIHSMPDSEKACGFISGKNEIMNWSKSDMFQFIYDTKSLYGDLKKLTGEISPNDIKLSAQTGVQNIYHALCHGFVFEHNHKQILTSLFKMAFFVLQAEYFLKNKEYISTQKDLFEKLQNEDREILKYSIEKQKILNSTDKEFEPENLYKKLLDWCKKRMH